MEAETTQQGRNRRKHANLPYAAAGSRFDCIALQRISNAPRTRAAKTGREMAMMQDDSETANINGNRPEDELAHEPPSMRAREIVRKPVGSPRDRSSLREIPGESRAGGNPIADIPPQSGSSVSQEIRPEGESELAYAGRFSESSPRDL